MARKKRKEIPEKELIIGLKAELTKKIQTDWPEKWQKHFGREYAGIATLRNKDGFAKALHKDMLEWLEKHGVEKPGSIMPSKDTIKRVADTNDVKDYQTNTKNVIAHYTGYGSWDNFRQTYRAVARKKGEKPEESRKIAPIPQQQSHTGHKKQQRAKVAAVIALAVIIGVGFFAFLDNEPTQAQLDIVQQATTAQTKLPRNIVFKYTVSHLNTDSITIDCGDNQEAYSRRNRRVPGRSNTISWLYTKPCVAVAKILHGEKVLASKPVVIPSNGWTGWFGGKARQKPHQHILSGNFTDEALLDSSSLYLNREYMQRIDSEAVYWTKFRNVRNFNVSADSLRFECRLRNTPQDGGIHAFDAIIRLYGKNGKTIECAFAEKDWTYFSYFTVADRSIDKDNNALNQKQLSLNVHDWNIISINTYNQRAELNVNGQKLLELEYEQLIGDLWGVELAFKGSGRADWVRISDNAGNEVFSDDFS